MTRKLAIGVSISALGVLGAMSAISQNEETGGDDVIDREPLRCVPMGQIQSADAVNDRAVLFYRRGGRIYVNILEQECPGLQRSNLFTYRVRGGARVARLCDTDSITVIDKLTNSAALTCRLGVFHPISDFQAEEILFSGRVPGNIAVDPVELPHETDEPAEDD